MPAGADCIEGQEVRRPDQRWAKLAPRPGSAARRLLPSRIHESSLVRFATGTDPGYHPIENQPAAGPGTGRHLCRAGELGPCCGQPRLVGSIGLATTLLRLHTDWSPASRCVFLVNGLGFCRRVPGNNGTLRFQNPQQRREVRHGLPRCISRCGTLILGLVACSPPGFRHGCCGISLRRALSNCAHGSATPPQFRLRLLRGWPVRYGSFRGCYSSRPAPSLDWLENPRTVLERAADANKFATTVWCWWCPTAPLRRLAPLQDLRRPLDRSDCQLRCTVPRGLRPQRQAFFGLAAGWSRMLIPVGVQCGLFCRCCGRGNVVPVCFIQWGVIGSALRVVDTASEDHRPISVYGRSGLAAPALGCRAYLAIAQ